MTVKQKDWSCVVTCGEFADMSILAATSDSPQFYQWKLQEVRVMLTFIDFEFINIRTFI